MSEEEKKAIKKLSSKQNETTWVDTIRQIKREEINDAVITRQKYITTILNLIEKQQKEIEELEKYDYRNIKISKDNKLSAIHFTKEQLDLMNLGIALYIGIPKLLEENEDNDDI